MFCDELAWDKPQCEINQPWNNDNVVQVAKHWDKVGNQIERHAEIAYGETQKYLGGKGSSRVGENPSIDDQLALEGTCEVFALLPHRGCTLHHLEKKFSHRWRQRAWQTLGTFS